MKRTKVNSSTLKSAGYQGTSFTLELEFTTGSVYQYSNVPISVYQELMDAPSKGSYFNDYIKDKYRYKKIEDGV